MFRTEIESRIRFFCISGLFLEGRIRVNVNIQDPNIRVTTVDCWATPEKDPFGDLQHYLIETGCGVDGVLDGTLRILENGQSKMAKWQGAVFQFVGYEEVWLRIHRVGRSVFAGRRGHSFVSCRYIPLRGRTVLGQN